MNKVGAMKRIFLTLLCLTGLTMTACSKSFQAKLAISAPRETEPATAGSNFGSTSPAHYIDANTLQHILLSQAAWDSTIAPKLGAEAKAIREGLRIKSIDAKPAGNSIVANYEVSMAHGGRAELEIIARAFVSYMNEERSRARSERLTTLKASLERERDLGDRSRTEAAIAALTTEARAPFSFEIN